eukprot:8898196-Alexandrium_andersonii.AAC.1
MKPRKPWISGATLALLEGRARLIRHGNWQALAEQNKSIKASARRDRVAWVEDSLQGSLWRPVRALTRPRQPR